MERFNINKVHIRSLVRRILCEAVELSSIEYHLGHEVPIVNRNHRKKTIQSNIDKLREILFEEMSISDEVRALTYAIGYRIESDFNSTQKYKENGVSVKKGNFDFEKDGIELNIDWKAFYYNITEEEDLPEKGASFRKDKNGDITIHVDFIVNNGTIERKRMYQSIQHELSHLFEFQNKGNGFKNQNRYNLAYDTLLHSEVGVRYDINLVIYLSFKEEQVAFGNGAYSFLMRSKDFDSGFENAVKQTKIFKYLGHVKDIYQDILNRSPYDAEVVFALNEHHLSREQFLVIARRTIKNLTWYMGRAVAKALKDYKDKNIAYFHKTIPINPPASIDNTLSESIRRRRKEIIERRYIFSKTKHS